MSFSDSLRSLETFAMTPPCFDGSCVANLTTIWRVEPEPTSCAASAGGDPASVNAVSTCLGVIDVPVTVSWYCVPPLNSTPTLKPRKMKLSRLISDDHGDA